MSEVSNRGSDKHEPKDPNEENQDEPKFIKLKRKNEAVTPVERETGRDPSSAWRGPRREPVNDPYHLQ